MSGSEVKEQRAEEAFGTWWRREKRGGGQEWGKEERMERSRRARGADRLHTAALRPPMKPGPFLSVSHANAEGNYRHYTCLCVCARARSLTCIPVAFPPPRILVLHLTSLWHKPALIIAHFTHLCLCYSLTTHARKHFLPHAQAHGHIKR